MDSRIKAILESLLLNSEVLNEQISALARSEHFAAGSESFQLLERIRGTCTCTLQNIRSIERSLWRKAPNGTRPTDHAG